MKLYVGWASTRYKNTRIFWMIVCLCLCAFGIVLMRQLPPRLKWGRWAGVVLADMYTANYGLLAALTSGNFGGFTKKSVSAALVCDLLRSPEITLLILLPSVRYSPLAAWGASLARSSTVALKRLRTQRGIWPC